MEHFYENRQSVKTLLLSDIPYFNNRFKQYVRNRVSLVLIGLPGFRKKSLPEDYYLEIVSLSLLETLKWGMV